MKGPERSPAQPARPVSPQDTKSVLYEAAREAVQERAQQARTRARPKPRRRRRFPVMGLLVSIAIAGATLLVIRPVWLVGPRALPAETPGVAAASLRVMLVRQRSLILNHLNRTGRLPATLIEADRAAPQDWEYRRDAAGFSVTGRAGDSVITIRSTDSVTVFLGNSFSRLRQRSIP